MKTKKYFLGLATLVAMSSAFTACSNEELEVANNETPKQQVENPITLSSAFKTRATSDNLQTTQIAEGVQVGVYIVDSNNAYITDANETKIQNSVFTADGNGGLTYSADAEIGWPDGEESLTVAAYAPKTNGWTSYSQNQRFSVKADQTTDADYLNSDLIYGTPASNPVAKTSETIALGFTHKLAKVNITVNKASDVNLASANLFINNVKTSVLIRPSTGAITEDTDAEKATSGDIKAATFAGTETIYKATAIVVPQTVEAGSVFVTIEANGNEVIAKLPSNVTFEGGSVYNFKVNVKALANDTPTPVEGVIELGSTSINDWTSGGAEIDLGDAAEVVEELGENVGKYVMSDGSIMAADASGFDKANAVAVIFSETVSTTDAAAGYNAYAVGLSRYKNRVFHADADNTAMMSTGAGKWSEGLNDLDGLSHTKDMLASAYYAARSDEEKTASVINLSDYSLTAPTGTSGWYLPSFGQMIQIMNNLGKAKIKENTVSEGDGIGSGSAFYTSASGALATLVSNMQANTTAADADLFSVGNVVYATSTENNSTSSSHLQKFWSIQCASADTYAFGKNTQRGGNGRSVLPVLAVKISQ